MNILIRAWLSEANYNSWAERLAAGEYVSPAEEPVFTGEISKELPDFAN